MLQIENLRVHYGDFCAVSSVSLSLAPGKIAALIGANSAGKSSLLSAVAGLIKPSSGRVLFQGEEVTGMSADQLVRRGLCLVPQGGRCFARMSVQDNLLMGSYPRNARARARESLEEVYALFPALGEKRRVLAGTLSGGQRQMVAIGRALMSMPKVLMFDEISLGLAPVVIRDLYVRIRQINQELGIAIMLVEQDMERALDIADTCYVMLKGAVTLSGPAASMDRETIKAAYFGI